MTFGKNGSGFLGQAALLTGIVVGVVGLVLTVFLPLYSPASPVESQVQAQDQDIRQAKDLAEEVRIHGAAIDARLRQEKVCTNTNQNACRALFDRLARNITLAQRKRLACDVLAALDAEASEQLRQASRCPRPLRP